jgi:hypothetical protein
MHVSLPDHPWFDHAVMRADPALLDRLAGDLGATSVTSFLFGDVARLVLGDVLTKEAASLPVAEYLWLMHLSGYFGGVWLRDQIARAQPEAPLLGVSVVPDADGFGAVVATMEASLTAARSEGVVAHNEAALDGHVDGYGYNRGYLLEILETPPAGLTSPPGFLQVDGPLASRYAVEEIAGLAPLRDRFAVAAAANPALVARIEGIEAEADARGRTVWSTGLSVQGFPQAEYEQLLDLSAFFLMATQAVALADALAVAEQDEAVGRTACIAAAALAPWSQSYMLGLLDGRDDRRLPALA